MKISYNWLKWYVPEIPEAEKLADVFTFHVCEVEAVEKYEDDFIFDLKVLPDRAHDLLSHLGVAREVSGLLGLPFNDPTSQYKIPESKPTSLNIEIEDAACRRYMGRIVRGIKVGPSPDWVVKHLASIGQRSVNNIVDATNLTMFNCGQPCHAFDAKKIEGEKIIVRKGKSGETVTTLDKKEISTDESVLVIADLNVPLALAGVKGGTKAEVDENTTDIVLEVANFEPITVRKTARKLGLVTDAAKRFENDLTPELVPYAIRELSSLIMEMCPEARFEDVIDVYPIENNVGTLKDGQRKILFNAGEISKLLGITISADEIEKILKNYSYIFSRDGEQFTFPIPANRIDLVGPHDMAEEIGRAYGYEKIPGVLPNITAAGFTPKLNETAVKIMMARTHFLESGFSEVFTYAFTKKGEIEVAYGAKDKSALRRNLSDGLKEAYELNVKNAALLEMDEIKLFEIGTVFSSADTDKEEIHVAWATKKGVEEYTLDEGTKDHPADTYQFPKNVDPKNSDSKSTELKKFKIWSQYPFIVRDIALWVSEGTDPETVTDVIRQNIGELIIAGPRLFDTFTKDGRTSMAFRTVFQSYDKTLTDAEIEPIMMKATEALKEKGWEVR